MSRELDCLENIYTNIGKNRNYAGDKTLNMFSVIDSWLDQVEPEITSLETMVRDEQHSEAFEGAGVAILGSLDAELSGIAGRLAMLAARVHRLHIPFVHSDPRQ